ncbi:hypothetical protein [Dietzia cinnamea]|uniref:hypothetical protein n=1 Tax=Dietzia cinnamea TaxID=321318 RepID=UPI00223ACE4A|nr:hypothetical protein [Dietzia cinnamea]MCT1863396.1 hypothetical protein [Dietzia cinnamea]
MSGRWWQTETEHEYDGETYTVRSRTCGVVWDPNSSEDDHPRRYRSWVRVQQSDDEDVPAIGLWLWNGITPAQSLSVDEARHLGQALLDAADLVDRERDAAIRQFLDNTP